MRASSGPSPNTVWVPHLNSSQRVQAFASSRSADQAASMLPPGLGADWARSIISNSRARAPAISGATSAVSGMLCQYFFGISFSIAFTFRRAGLKMLA